MTRQIPLSIVPRLAYDPQRLLLYAGLREELERALFVPKLSNLRLCLIHGAPRAGKTHLSLRLADEYSRQGREVRLTSGTEFLDLLIEGCVLNPDSVLVVDDADACLSLLNAEKSGLFVRLVEQLRVNGGTLVLLLAGELAQFPFDEHVRSRLVSAVVCRLGAPGPEDMPELIRLMARQRGLFLTDRKICFLARRLRREIPAIDACLWRAVELAVAGQAGGISFAALAECLGSAGCDLDQSAEPGSFDELI